MTQKHIFTEETYSFLAELKLINEKTWFTENKSRFEQHVKAPMISFIGSFATPLEEISPHMVADTSLNGGSMFRIYRDVRFSKNKDPYKTHAAAQFRHSMGKDVHAPGFYFHVSPEENLFGAGIWKPDSKSLTAIRSHIDSYQKDWINIKEDTEFMSETELAGDSLVRPPRGFSADHPLIEDLKRKDFMVIKNVAKDSILSSSLVDEYQRWCKLCSPFMNFICDALQIPYQEK